MLPAPFGLYDPKYEHDSCGVGCVATLRKEPSHRVVRLALDAVINLAHRGAICGDGKTGDGAGLLIQVPHDYYARECKPLSINLPDAGAYGVGMVFMPQDDDRRAVCRQIIQDTVVHEGQTFLGWRDVPTCDDTIGDMAKRSQPVVQQFFVGSAVEGTDALERKLYVIRNQSEKQVKKHFDGQEGAFYICGLSSKLVVYKGLVLAEQIEEYYPELGEDLVATKLAIIHQRYSTNTFPTWQRAQPFRYAAHNGEINTLRGNINRMRGRENEMSSRLFGDDLQKLFPIIDEQGSDSAMLDNALELLMASGRSLPHAVMMMIPEAFGSQYHMSQDKRAFYEYHASFMEPWDGPAALVVTDGRYVGATLDRNGLRPARYVVTHSGYVVMASEVGVVQFPDDDYAAKGRLQPGKMLLVDTEQGRIVPDNEVKSSIARRKPYRRWLQSNQLELRGLFDAPSAVQPDHATILTRQFAFGYTREEMRMILKPMAVDGQEAVGSMGTDTPLAVLSKLPQLLFSYFKQLFAQVTNPPIDPLRETLVMSLMTFVGREGNLLDETPEHCRQLKLPHPILSNDDMQRLKRSDNEHLRACVIEILFDPDGGGDALEAALHEVCQKAQEKILEGYALVILSDRGVCRGMAPIPSLLAASAVHQHLLAKALRSKAGIVVESGEVRECMHFALLLGYGCNAINPYLAFETITDLLVQGDIVGFEREVLIDNYINAVKKGLLKTFSRMGISTLRSYCGAQIFEAVGLNEELVNRYFPGTASRIGGIDLEIMAEETRRRFARAYPEDGDHPDFLEDYGQYHYRRGGEAHLNDPNNLGLFQHACRQNDWDAYKKFADAINHPGDEPVTLRRLFELKSGEPVPIEEVEPVGEITKRFCTGAMSFGSLGKEAHESLAIGMNRIGAKSNTGEGGEDPERYKPLPNGDSKNSAIKQVASGRFGVTIEYLVNAKELQIKMAQGAKPGEGGQLPGHKVDEAIAKVRFSTPGVSLISPPPHHDIYSIEDLKQLIHDLKNANPEARISVKLVSEVGVGTIAAGVAKGMADMVLISGHDGGTGASPLTSIKYAGMPWELGLAETQQVLVANELRDKIRVQTDGQLKTGRDVAIAALLGAEEYGFGTAALIAIGCIMARKCHLNTCPVGVATQDKRLRERFIGSPDHVANYFTFVARELREIMAAMGFRTVDEMVGRVDRIEAAPRPDHWKAKRLDLSRILTIVEPREGGSLRCTHEQDHGLEHALDNEIIRLAEPSIERQEPVKIELPIKNTNRTVGTMLSSRIAKKYGLVGLPDGTIKIEFKGSAGQSFGAFLSRGISINLEGDANDYFGKGMSGGRIAVYPPRGTTFKAAENIIIGNVAHYGATGGESYVCGMAGERFCVRNSGARAIVEGVGDHGCEYMTSGEVLVLGPTGVNFAAGMSGGYAYVLDENQLFDTRCNLQMVDLEQVTDATDLNHLHDWVARHYSLTGSARAEEILQSWDQMAPLFVKVVPIDYRRALERMKAKREDETAVATEEVYRG